MVADDPFRDADDANAATGDDYCAEFSVRSQFRQMGLTLDGVLRAAGALHRARRRDTETLGLINADVIDESVVVGAPPQVCGHRTGARLDLTLRAGSRAPSASAAR